MPLRRRWLVPATVMLVGTGALVWAAVAGRGADAQQAPARTPQPNGLSGGLPRTVDQVLSQFPSARGWFRIVAGARFSRATDGRLVPDFDSLTHARVRRADNAGHTVVPHFARMFDAPMRIASGQDAGVWIEIAPVGGRHVGVQQQDGLIVYVGAYADTDVLFKSTPTHTDEYLLLRTRSAPTEWRYRFSRGPAIASVRQVGNTLEVVDGQDVARMRSSRPVATDARGTRVDGTLRVEGDTIIVRVDTANLTYPVLVDPDWRSTGDMSYGRFYFASNVLPSGRVFVSGGCSASVCSGDLALAACRTVVRATETLDLGTRMWSAAGDDAEARFFHASVSLSTGAVLLAGGCTNPDCSTTTANARWFEPSDSSFRTVPDLAEARGAMSAVRLADGRVLVAGGCDSARCTTATEIFDPVTHRWSRGVAMRVARGRAEIVTLADGRILVAGGCTDTSCTTVLASAEVYDPVLDRWTPTSPMGTPRAGHFAATLLDGRVLVGGGCPDQRCSTFLRSTELFDPTMMRFVAGPDQRTGRVGARASRLPDGTVMVNQGCETRSDCDLTNERFDPRTATFGAMESAVTARAFHELIEHTGARTLVAIGGCQPGTCSWWNETYDTSGIPTAPMDAGTDAATDTGSDAVAPDASGRDTLPPPADVRAASDVVAAMDAGIVPPPRTGCGCRTAGQAESRATLVLAVVLAACAGFRRGAPSRRRGLRPPPKPGQVKSEE